MNQRLKDLLEEEREVCHVELDEFLVSCQLQELSLADLMFSG